MIRLMWFSESQPVTSLAVRSSRSTRPGCFRIARKIVVSRTSSAPVTRLRLLQFDEMRRRAAPIWARVEPPDCGRAHLVDAGVCEAEPLVQVGDQTVLVRRPILANDRSPAGAAQNPLEDGVLDRSI